MPKDSNVGSTVQTTLDRLPYGAPDMPEASGRVKKVKLPDGVTSRELLRDVVLIAWPSFVELVLTQLTTMADQVMVGRLPGQEGIMALSAVGLAGQPKFLLMTMVQALNVGATAVIARFRGQQNQEKANQVFKHALILNFVISAVFMLIGLFSSEWLIRLMSGKSISGETMSLGIEYFRIQMYGFIPLCMGFTITAALRGIGDTKTPMIYNTVANVINLFFNYMMIYGNFGFKRMGVAGASWATIIGQTVAFIISAAVILSKRRYIFLDLKEKFHFDRDIMRDVTKIGLPSMLEQLIIRAGIVIFLIQVAGLGDMMYATHQVAISVQAMSFMIGQAFSNASTTLMGQCLGKGRPDMAQLYVSTTRLIGLGTAVVLMAAMVLFNEEIISLYNTNEEVIRTGSGILLMIAVTQPFQADQFIVSGGLRGAGDTRYTAMVMFISTLAVRTILCMLMVNVFKLELVGAWIAMATDMILRAVLIALRYQSGKWKEIKLGRAKG